MTTIDQRIRLRHAALIAGTDLDQVREGIEETARVEGLGVAMSVAWQHGLASGYIPRTLDDEPPASIIPAAAGCPYTFVHVPVRRIRGNTRALIAAGIMSGSPDPARLAYHEDGIIEAATFRGRAGDDLAVDEVPGLLAFLEGVGLLVRVQPDDPRIRFVEPGTPERFRNDKEPLYVRDLARSVADTVMPGLRGRFDTQRIEGICSALQPRSPCFYCSAGTLFPREVTLSTRRSLPGIRRRHLARDYELGFTFAPVGHPGEICHVLAWDDPPPGTPIANMDLQPHSFRDLIELVQLLNAGLDAPDDRACPTIWGICNHRAGNTIAHQHYQFVRLSSLPLDGAFQCAIAGGLQPIARLGGIGVWTMGSGWPIPAYLIAPLPGTTADPARTSETLLKTVDLVTAAWRSHQARDATQNLVVTSRNGQARAIFIPRDRRLVDATCGDVTKRNAGALEAMGYFVIDDPTTYRQLDQLPDQQRRALGTGWLTAIAPEPEWISRFEGLDLPRRFSGDCQCLSPAR